MRAGEETNARKVGRDKEVAPWEHFHEPGRSSPNTAFHAFVVLLYAKMLSAGVDCLKQAAPSFPLQVGPHNLLLVYL